MKALTTTEMVHLVTFATIDFASGGRCPLHESQQDSVRNRFLRDLRRCDTVADVRKAVLSAEAEAIRIARRDGFTDWEGASAVVGFARDSAGDYMIETGEGLVSARALATISL